MLARTPHGARKNSAWVFGADVRAARESVFGRRRVSVRSALIPAWWDCWEAEKLISVMFFFSLVFSSLQVLVVEWRVRMGLGSMHQCIMHIRIQTQIQIRGRVPCPGLLSTFAIGALPALNGR